MAYIDTKQFKHLKSVWECAYNGEIVVIDYTNEPEAEGRMLRFKNSLYNYRKRVRLRKLRPDLVDEWSRLEQCKITQITPTIIHVERMNKLLFTRKMQKVIPNNQIT